MSARDLAADEIQALRVDLAAAFRLTVEFGWSESVGNHFSAAVSADGRRFLLNPKWRHFGAIRASELLLVDADDRETLSRPDAPDSSAWTIHGAMHRGRPNVRVLAALPSALTRPPLDAERPLDEAARQQHRAFLQPGRH